MEWPFSDDLTPPCEDLFALPSLRLLPGFETESLEAPPNLRRPDPLPLKETREPPQGVDDSEPFKEPPSSPPIEAPPSSAKVSPSASHADDDISTLFPGVDMDVTSDSALVGDPREREELEREIGETDPVWLENARLVLAFVRTYRKLPNIRDLSPRGFTREKVWLRKQRMLYKCRRPARDSKRDWLNTIPLWRKSKPVRYFRKPQLKQWSSRCRELKEYYDTHGFLPARSYKNAQGFALGDWLCRNACWHRKGCVASENLAMLRTIPFFDDYAQLDRGWRYSYTKFREYVANMGWERVKGTPLAGWFENQLECSQLSRAQIKFLTMFVQSFSSPEREEYQTRVARIGVRN